VRLLAFIEYAAVLAGVIGVLAGRFFALAKGFHLGVFLIGAGIGLGGIEAVLTRRMPFRSADDACEAYAGAPALIVGLMALLVGAGIVGSAYLLSDGLWHSTLNDLARRPAPVLGAAGLLLMGIGALMMLNPQGRTGWAWRLLVYLPRSVAGLVLFAGGLAAIALGAWDWFQPQAFDSFVRELRPLLRRLPYSA
jgi:hypothetical protein